MHYVLCDDEGRDEKVQPFHFFASNLGTWMVDEDMHKLIARMEDEGLGYNIFYIPKPMDSNYEILTYCPDVDGAIWLGHKRTSEIA